MANSYFSSENAAIGVGWVERCVSLNPVSNLSPYPISQSAPMWPGDDSGDPRDLPMEMVYAEARE